MFKIIKTVPYYEVFFVWALYDNTVKHGCNEQLTIFARYNRGWLYNWVYLCIKMTNLPEKYVSYY